MGMFARLGIVLALFSMAIFDSVAESTESKGADAAPDFNREIRPILSENCFHCHGPDDETRKADLRLDTQEGIFQDLGGYHAVVPDNLDASELYYRITTTDEHERMPPKDSERALSDEQKDLIKRWIEAGALWNDHWAYVSPKRPPLPRELPQGFRASNPIDHFIGQRLMEIELSQSEMASKQTLLRRVSLDLVGLPPSPGDIEAFVSDESPDAYEKVIDHLLESERFGERWARPWLDLARYADSNGFQADQLRPSWAYRDYVINALNHNVPFNKFTIDQIAGDLLPNPTINQLIATGFHRTVTCNVEAGVNPEENRVNQVVDRVNTTGTVWLGTTLECAQCHDHKYDPISTKEYYQFFDFFNNTPLEVSLPDNDGDVSHDFVGPYLDLPIDDQREQELKALQKKLEEFNAQYDSFKEESESGFAKWKTEALLTLEENPASHDLPENVVNILKKEPSERNNQQKETLRDHYLNMNPEVSKLNAFMEKLERKIDRLKPVQTLVMEEMEESRATYVMVRGDYLDQGEEVASQTPQFLHPLDEDIRRNRLGLARWLVDRKNPLVARVTVNRWWAEIFGQGIVRTLEDFGMQSDPPTHQELLDWLAVEFMDSGWDMKHMLRLMVLSETYKQSSVLNETLLQKDPKNLYYARAPRFRLDAETIRDQGLFASGLLSTELYGEPVMPYQPPDVWNQTGRGEPVWDEQEDSNRWRRGIYVVYRRAAPYPSFVNFDAPDRSACTVKRSRTNTSTQALTLLNDPVYVEMALALADRILCEAPDESTRARIDYAMLIVAGRPAIKREIETLSEALEEQVTVFAKNPDKALELLQSSSDVYKTHHDDKKELAAWHFIATVLLNLDEVITKG